ncbi:MAG: bacterial Ig-like domain-containing protein, partial [Acutalibacteraceae bacterium]|nr:bacterial Ig-like domain-containing protein [Acutalibacteraceae bacterium]
IKITATYNNGSTQDVTSSVTYSGFDSSSAGEKTVTVSYSGKTTTFKVTVIALAVTKIAVTTPPTKTSYYVGDKLDTTGIKITATYNNDSTKDVTSSVTYSGFDSSTAGEKIVTVAYQGKTASFKVNVAALAVTSIAVTTQPTKKSYYIGEALDTTGIKITATYNNGSTKDVTSSVTYSGFDSSTAGEKTVTVTYQGITTVFKVNVIALAVTSIAVTNQPTKTSYYVGDKLDTAGIRITATYNNGSTKDVTSSVTYSGFDSSTAGDKNVTVTYEGKTAVFTVTVKAITIKRIEITAVPSKTSYYVGETFDASGIKVIAHYNNDSQKDVSSSVTYSGFNSSTSGTKTITVTYEGKTAQFDVYILDNKVEKITITKAPDKTVYYTGEEINLSGLTVIAQYSNGSTEDVSSQIKGVRNFDNTAPGTQNVEIEYGGKTATFSVTVIKLEVERLELTPPTKTKYFVGQALDFTGMKVTAVYNNGSRKDVTADVTINGADTSTAGTKAVIVWYESKSAEFNITVIQAEVVSLDFVPPTKTEYYIGESLDLSGMMVRAHFSDGTSEIVSDKVTISGFDSTTEGVKTITVEYGSKSVSFEVTVYKKEAVLEYITVTPPQKQNYFVGETFDPNGMSVIAHYSDESTVDITSHAIITGFDATTSGEKTITVEYMGFTASFDITVYEIVLEYISVTPPQKVQYIVGESPDMTGFEATAYYSNGSVQNVTDKVSVNGFDTSSAGIKSVEVVFGDKTAYFEIIVSEKEIYLDYIEVIPPETTTYYVGESLDTTGMKVTAYYSDGSTLDVTDSVNIYGFDSSCIDTIEITVEYMGKTASFYVTIIELEDYIISLTVSPPYKTEYYIGESLDLTGMSAYVLYTDATVEDVTQYVTVSGYDCMKEGVQTITVTYQNVSDTFEVTVKQIESELMYIEVTPPSKTIYYVGEQLNTEGMTVLAYYSSDDIIDVTQSVTLTGFTSDTAGDITVTVEYNGKTAEFTVTIIDIELVKIEVTPPDKRVYNIGESFSSDGMKVTAYYSNSETKEVYDYSVSGFDSSTEGVKTITVEYQGKTASFEITVLADDVVLESISVTPPSKTVYEYGEQLDTNGMVVMAHYSNGAQEEITSFVTITGFDSTTTGTQQITVEYQGCTAYFEVFVYSPAIINIERIEVTPPNKTVYSIGESLDLDGMIVIAYYSNGNRENVTNDCEVSGFDSTAAGTITLTVSYQGKTAEFTVTILKPEVYLDHISVVYPTKTTYSIGEAFDPTGMSVYAYYSDGSILDVTQQAEISGFDSGYAGEQLITVSYGGFSESFTVNVYLIESELLYIEIAELPYKLHYWKDEYINIDGLKVNAYYSTGEIVDVTGQVSVYGYNMYNVGEQSVTVEFENKSTEFTVYVHEIELLYIEIVPPTKRVYFVGDYLDTTGLEVRAYYSNGDIENIYYVSVTGYDNETPGIQTITVEYEGKTATFEIEVKYPAVIALEIIEPDKTVYDVGEELDLSGFMLWAIYEDGTKYYIGEKYTVTGFDSTTAGIQVITVEYEGVTIQFTVEVVPNTTILLGDVNCDGKITARDALIVLRYSIGLIKDITDDIFTAMDVDRNGKATAADALLIQRYAVGLIKEF